MRLRQGPVFPGYLMILLVALLGLALQVSPQTTRVVQDWALPVIVVCMLLIPLVLTWEKGQERRWIVLPWMTPEDDPFRCLAYSLADVLGADAGEIGAELRRGPAALRRRVDELRRGRRNRSVLIVVDQAEERGGPGAACSGSSPGTSAKPS